MPFLPTLAQRRVITNIDTEEADVSIHDLGVPFCVLEDDNLHYSSSKNFFPEFLVVLLNFVTVEKPQMQ